MRVMRKKNQSKIAPIGKSVVVDSHRGILYYDDSACRIKKFHDKGYRNIYSVVLTYHVPVLAKWKIIRMDYGQFHQAQWRYYIETNKKYSPSKMNIKEIRLLVSTFDGTKLINEDVMQQVEFGKVKLQGFDINMPIVEEVF